MIVLWNASVFSGVLVEVQCFGLIVKFTSSHNNASWTLVSVYGPCQGIERDNFVRWLYNLQIPISENWLLVGDFNFIRSHENRDKPRGDTSDMFLFNEIIGHLGLLELPLKGRAYMWSNMQEEPLLEQLDWFFTSSNWISDYPNSMVFPLANTGSDNVPCVINIDTNIPKAKKIRFENYWVDMPGFQECVASSWAKISSKSYSSAIVADKLKSLRYDLRKWHTSLSKIKNLIQNCNKVILALDTLEEIRPLYKPEFNFRIIIKLHLDDLLMMECNYWRKRCTIRWIKQGEDNTKFFHAIATERFRRNNIAMLRAEDGREVTDHHEMAGLLWSSYKAHMGQSNGIDMQFDLSVLLRRVEGLDDLVLPFSKKNGQSHSRNAS
jgi:mannosylglycoprotein endo-beta-mannosidase